MGILTKNADVVPLWKFAGHEGPLSMQETPLDAVTVHLTREQRDALSDVAWQELLHAQREFKDKGGPSNAQYLERWAAIYAALMPR